MFIVEPCCAPKHLAMLRKAAATDGTAVFEGYGDLSLAEILPALMMRHARSDVLIAAPSLPDQAAEAVVRCMRRKVALMDGSGNVDVIRRLTVIADLGAGQSPCASLWLQDNPFPGRLVLHDVVQPETAILLGDFAITGPVNMRYGRRFVATAVGSKDLVDGLWARFGKLAAAR